MTSAELRVRKATDTVTCALSIIIFLMGLPCIAAALELPGSGVSGLIVEQKLLAGGVGLAGMSMGGFLWPANRHRWWLLVPCMIVLLASLIAMNYSVIQMGRILLAD